MNPQHGGPPPRIARARRDRVHVLRCSSAPAASTRAGWSARSSPPAVAPSRSCTPCSTGTRSIATHAADDAALATMLAELSPVAHRRDAYGDRRALRVDRRDRPGDPRAGPSARAPPRRERGAPRGHVQRPGRARAPPGAERSRPRRPPGRDAQPRPPARPLGRHPDPALAGLPSRAARRRGERRPHDRRRRAAGDPDADPHRASRHPRSRRRAARPAREPARRRVAARPPHRRRAARARAGVRGARAPRRRRRRPGARGSARRRRCGTCASPRPRRCDRSAARSNAARLLEIVHHDCAEVAEVAAATLAAIAPAIVSRAAAEEDAHPRCATRRACSRPASRENRGRGRRHPVGGLRRGDQPLLSDALAARPARDEEDHPAPRLGLAPGGALLAAHARRLDRRAGVQRGGGDPRLGRLAPRPALPGLRDRDRRRRLDRRDGRAG